jgi:hypothetical protein
MTGDTGDAAVLSWPAGGSSGCLDGCRLYKGHDGIHRTLLYRRGLLVDHLDAWTDAAYIGAMMGYTGRCFTVVAWWWAISY